MNTTKTRRPSQAKPARKCGWYEPLGPNPGDVGCLKITQTPPRKGEDAETFYLVERLATDFGVGLNLEKLKFLSGEPTVTEAYAVNLDGQHSTCECKGFTRWAHCKHLESLTALKNANRL